MADDPNPELVDLCYSLALRGHGEGGVPVGSVLASGPAVLATGYNRRVQRGDPIAHGEMDCLRNAGRRPSYRDTTLYTSLSPCMMCSGAIIQFKIPRLVILDDVNFGGNEEFLRSNGVDVRILGDERCIALMRDFIDRHPDLWNEDIAEGQR